MAEGGTDLVQRVGHKFEDYGIEDLDDISYSSGGSDSESDYGADREDNADYPDEKVVVKDPGPFRYNKKMFIVSLPCALMVMTLVGEIFLMAASFGAGVIVILDPKGEKKRCLILFTLLFIFCHMYTIYSIVPLLWLSFFNLFLIGVINIYVILTGGLIALQFTFFRKFEQKLAATVERMLFSIYPWCCVMLLTWTASSVIRWQLIPYVYIALGFVYLQMFMTPHTSSFREGKSDELDLNIVPEVISLTMAIIYCISPSMLHMMLHFINGSLPHVFSTTVMMHLLFILSLSIFLTTLMSLRGVFDFNGWRYDYVIYGRTISGIICTGLLYPVLIHYQLSSHFLPWLPAGVFVYAMYGYLLSDKKYKVLSSVLLPFPSVLFAFWMTWLPWKISYPFPFGVEMTGLYILLLVNCILCFMCVFGAVYFNPTIFESFVIAESAVFTLCEVLLCNGNLYPKSFFIITAAIVLYTFHRLYTSGKISSFTTTWSSSIHVTKAIVVIIYHLIGTEDDLSIYRCITLYLLSAVIVRIISMDTHSHSSVKEVIYNILSLSVVILINSNPLLHLFCVYVLWEEPTTTDLLGLCVMVVGVCIIIIGSLQLPEDSVTAVRQTGVVCSSMGVLILVLQPQVTLEFLSILQWGDLASIVLIVYVLLSKQDFTMYQLCGHAVLAGICPGIRMSTLLYTYSDEIPSWAVIGRVILYVPACICVISLIFIFCKMDTLQRQLEKNLYWLCQCLGVLSVLLLFYDTGLREKNSTVMSLPAWKLSLVTTGLVSVSLKILSTIQDLLIPIVEEKTEKEIPKLPLVGNISCILTFLLACLQAPVHGILYDIWCCGAALILLCLQKDRRLFDNIKQENQIVPTMFACILILYSASIVRSDLWTTGGLSFLRSLLEISTILAVLPMYYVLWGILWQGRLVLSEQVVVFLLPLNAVFMLYGSSYTSQALAAIGIYAGVWMMLMKLPLNPYTGGDR
ncbi:Pleckstrin y domain-containing A member 1 [Mactra antiquata]